MIELPDERLTFTDVPTAADVARRLGVADYNVGVVRAPSGNVPGSADVNLHGQLGRVEFIVEGVRASARPTRPRQTVRVLRTPPSPEVDRHAVVASDRARRAEVERRHRQALLRVEHRQLGALVASHRQATGCTPAWALNVPGVTITAASYSEEGRGFDVATDDCPACRILASRADGSPPVCVSCRTKRGAP